MKELGSMERVYLERIHLFVVKRGWPILLVGKLNELNAFSSSFTNGEFHIHLRLATLTRKGIS